jgi:hypothetical protein
MTASALPSPPWESREEGGWLLASENLRVNTIVQIFKTRKVAFDPCERMVTELTPPYVTQPRIASSVVRAGQFQESVVIELTWCHSIWKAVRSRQNPESGPREVRTGCLDVLVFRCRECCGSCSTSTWYLPHVKRAPPTEPTFY